MSRVATDRAAYGRLAEKIEAELRSLGLWGHPPPAGPVRGPFGAPDLTFTQWLEHVLCPRLREIAAGRGEPPDRSSVAAMAVRELDGVEGAGGLIDALTPGLVRALNSDHDERGMAASK